MQEQGTQTQNVGSGYLPLGGGLPCEGVGAKKKSVCPSKPRETKFLGGISRDFGWDIPGAPEKIDKKCLRSIFMMVQDVTLRSEINTDRYKCFSGDYLVDTGTDRDWKKFFRMNFFIL